MMKEIWVLVPVLLLLPPVVCGQAADMVTETFVHYTQMKSWMDAQAFCRQYNSDMISVRDNQDNQNFHPVPGWLGLHRLDFRSPWKWSKGDEMANITYWAFGEPSLLNNCAYKDANSLVWKTHGCTVLHTYSCYNEVLILVKENKTWEEALHHCRSLQAVDPSRPATENNNNLYDLVTLITEDDHVNTRKKIQDATTDKYPCLLDSPLHYVHPPRNVWSHQLKQVCFNIHNCLIVYEPSLTENCAFKQPSALTWASDGCDVHHSFTCYSRTAVLVKENKTWEEALNHCRALEAVDPSKPATEYKNNRYDLISLVTDDDYSYIQKKIKDATTDEVWTGLRFLAGEWLWVNGATVQYDDIQSCPAEGFCGILVKNSTAQFGISDCKQRKNFVCIRKPLGI
ncbi:hypothetical protein Q5P01_016731 [Channa striata]|uniref:C-type lectin domain-containing protein n=1 Tax=Channa striata TaxID=64152 RepID=A0AA88MBW3_CHASR|nr:hypothetical protein Q5P01_016731 [Channa striata]